MIKASELRLGNLAKGDGDTLGRVCVIGLHELEYSHLFNPIPLTAEWLERLGFDNMCCIVIALDDSTHTLQIIKTTNDALLLDRLNSITATLRPVKYVHQLQNLYFALTGEELTVKDLKLSE